MRNRMFVHPVGIREPKGCKPLSKVQLTWRCSNEVEASWNLEAFAYCWFWGSLRLTSTTVCCQRMMSTGLELTWLDAQAGTIELHRLSFHVQLLATLLHFLIHLPHKTFRNVVVHCKPAFHETYHLMRRAVGFATRPKTIHPAPTPGRPTSCQPPQRALNWRCSVQTSPTNSAKVLACPRPRRTHAEPSPHPRRHLHISRCADGLVVSGDSADDILVNIPYNTSLG